MNYCTLFNQNYLTRGVAMIESLTAHAPHSHIYALCFDETTLHTLQALKLSNLTLISLGDFEDDELLAIKPSRTLGEYCWTCTPSLILYCIEHFHLASCTYVDADLYFFENPQLLLDEMGQDSILLTKHNYTPIYNQESTSGIYCVQFMCFKADENGLKALRWWREKCLEWCFARAEDGKFGDQKYLDDWTERFEGVYVPNNPRYALAPWNIQQYDQLKPLFYHFHALKFIEDDKVDLCSYQLSQEIIERIYTPYIQHLVRLREHFMPHNFDGRSPKAKSKPLLSRLTQLKGRDFRALLASFKRLLHKSQNLYPLSHFTSHTNPKD